IRGSNRPAQAAPGLTGEEHPATDASRGSFMSMGGRWKVALGVTSCVLGIGGCDLSQLVNDKIEEFGKRIKVPAVGVQNAEQTIGENGGEAITQHGALSVPAGAVDDEVTISVAEAPASDI